MCLCTHTRAQPGRWFGVQGCLKGLMQMSVVSAQAVGLVLVFRTVVVQLTRPGGHSLLIVLHVQHHRQHLSADRLWCTRAVL
jgi:hypothetical protein